MKKTTDGVCAGGWMEVFSIYRVVVRLLMSLL